VFSGTARWGQKVRILGPICVQGKKEEVHVKSVESVEVSIGWRLESMEDCPGGNTMLLVGTCLNLQNSGKIADREEVHNIDSMNLSVSLTVEKVV
jgi:hypothetical protein